MESQSQTDEINKVKAQIEGLEGREKAGESSKELDARMAETLRRLNLLTEQRGKFASHFRCPFLFLSITYFCPLSFDISSSPIQWRQVRKVRGDGLCRDVNILQCYVL
jgi:hypothetical protein